MEKQSRQDSKSSSEKGRAQEERDQPTGEEPPPANQNEDVISYSARLDSWAQQQKTHLRTSEGYATFREEIEKKRNDAFLAYALNVKSEYESKLLNVKSELKSEYESKLEDEREDASVKRLLATFGGMPSMKKNYGATASLPNSNGKRGNDNNCESASKKQKGPNHKPATIMNLEPANIPTMLKDLKINFFEKRSQGEIKPVKSTLAVSLGKNRDDEDAQLSNFNEASVSLHLVSALQDVQACLGLTNAEVGQEMSFFSMRPDLVVLKENDTIVLVIEVKNARSNAQAVMDSEKAAGRCLDHAYALKSTNIEKPIVCLSTYSKMRIGSSEQSIEGIIKKAMERLNEVTAENPFTSVPSSDKKPKPGPEKIGKATKIPLDSKEEEKDITPASFEVENEERMMYFSSTFDLKNMFQALTLAVACGCISAVESQEANGDGSDLHLKQIPEEGEVITKRLYNEVRENSCKWVTLQSTEAKILKATYKLKTDWRSDLKVYMSLILGMGNKGKVYLCMDSLGRHFAVKMLFLDSKFMGRFCHDDGMDKKTQKMEALKEILSTEAERWKEIYPEYKVAIWEGILNALPCLAMPYVASIPMKRRNEVELLVKIETEAMRIAKLGYFCDYICWRDIGLRLGNGGEEKIVFVDMERMIELGEKTPDEVVEKCMDSLRESSGLGGTERK